MAIANPTILYGDNTCLQISLPSFTLNFVKHYTGPNIGHQKESKLLGKINPLNKENILFSPTPLQGFNFMLLFQPSVGKGPGPSLPWGGPRPTWAQNAQKTDLPYGREKETNAPPCRKKGFKGRGMPKLVSRVPARGTSPRGEWTPPTFGRCLYLAGPKKGRPETFQGGSRVRPTLVG